jgi:hypothetical protein
MPYTPEHRQAMRERILASARRLFNRRAAIGRVLHASLVVVGIIGLELHGA